MNIIEQWNKQMTEIVRRLDAVSEGLATDIIKSIDDNGFYFICQGDLIFNLNFLSVTESLTVHHPS